MRVDSIIKSRLEPLLNAAGFRSAPALLFYRDLPSGVRWNICFESRRAGDQFAIWLMVNSVTLDPPGFGYVRRFFTGGSISPSKRSFSSATPDEIKSAAMRVELCWESHILPFFAEFPDLSSVADAMGDGLDVVKSRLYLLAGDVPLAQEWGRRCIERLRADGATAKELAEAEVLLALAQEEG
jgi:hypothetical protein